MRKYSEEVLATKTITRPGPGYIGQNVHTVQLVHIFWADDAESYAVRLKDYGIMHGNKHSGYWTRANTARKHFEEIS